MVIVDWAYVLHHEDLAPQLSIEALIRQLLVPEVRLWARVLRHLVRVLLALERDHWAQVGALVREPRLADLAMRSELLLHRFLIPNVGGAACVDIHDFFLLIFFAWLVLLDILDEPLHQGYIRFLRENPVEPVETVGHSIEFEVELLLVDPVPLLLPDPFQSLKLLQHPALPPGLQLRNAPFLP